MNKPTGPVVILPEIPLPRSHRGAAASGGSDPAPDPAAAEDAAAFRRVEHAGLPGRHAFFGRSAVPPRPRSSDSGRTIASRGGRVERTLTASGHSVAAVERRIAQPVDLAHRHASGSTASPSGRRSPAAPRHPAAPRRAARPARRCPARGAGRWCSGSRRRWRPSTRPSTCTISPGSAAPGRSFSITAA